MNGGLMGDGPGKYVRAWRHVHDVFEAEGADNVVWVWCPLVTDVPAEPWNHWTNYYPGEIESAAEQVPGVMVSFVAACGVRSPYDGMEGVSTPAVVPAKAGTHLRSCGNRPCPHRTWIPAFAGMTAWKAHRRRPSSQRKPGPIFALAATVPALTEHGLQRSLERRDVECAPTRA